MGSVGTDWGVEGMLKNLSKRTLVLHRLVTF